MKKFILVFLLLGLISCVKESKNSVTAENTPTLAVKTIKKVITRDVISTDTVRFYNDGEQLNNEFVLAHLLQKKYDKDSICDAYFKLDFIKNKKLLYNQKIHIKGYDNGSDWYGNIEFDAVSSRLKTITLGYPACGYTHYNYLFYVDEKKPGLIHQWESMSDSGWGTWGQLLSGNSDNFYFRTESFSPKEDSEDLGIAEYSDSIHFELKANVWQKTFVTKKGEVYRTKEVDFNAFHQSSE
jgi:hypothetical protein